MPKPCDCVIAIRLCILVGARAPLQDGLCICTSAVLLSAALWPKLLHLPLVMSLGFPSLCPIVASSRSAELHPLKPLTEQPGHDHPRPSEEYAIHRGGDGTR